MKYNARYDCSCQQKHCLFLLKTPTKCHEQMIQCLFADISPSTVLWYLHTTRLYLAELSSAWVMHINRGTEPFFICARILLGTGSPKALFGFLL